MAQDDPSLKVPDPENWLGDFGYGFLLDRTFMGKSAYSPTLKRVVTLDDMFASATEDVVILDLNPQQISMAEPLATAVQFTQGGGKLIESRGGVIKNLTVRGTTGMLPPSKVPRKISVLTEQSLGASLSVEQNSARTKEQAQRSGFKAFYRLRQLFRMFMALRKQGELVLMHWLDFKADEYWVVEPMSFDMPRDSKRPFLYNYNIQCQCVAPSELNTFISAGLARTGSSRSRINRAAGRSDIDYNTQEVRTSLSVANLPRTDRSVRAAMSRLETLRTKGPGALLRLSGESKLWVQSIMTRIDDVVGLIDDFGTATGSLLEATTRNTNMVLSTLVRSLDTVLSSAEAFSNRTQSFDTLLGLQEFYLETRLLFEGLISKWAPHASDLNDLNEEYIRGRASEGVQNDLFPTEDDDTVLFTDPFVGELGLESIADIQEYGGSQTFTAVPILRGETIWDVAQRLLGDQNLFMFLVVLNRLNAPYIVMDPLNKPPNTLAWGESIMKPEPQDGNSQFLSTAGVPTPTFTGTVSEVGTSVEVRDYDRPDPLSVWRLDQWIGFTVSIVDGPAAGDVRILVSNDANVLVASRPFSTLLQPGNTYTVEQVTFDRRRPAGPDDPGYGKDFLVKYDPAAQTVDLVFGADRRYGEVRGREAFDQAITLRLITPRGGNKAHPTYGVGLPIGRPMTPQVQALYQFFARQTLYADPAVKSVGNGKVLFTDGGLSFYIEVQPTRAQKARSFRLAF